MVARTEDGGVFWRCLSAQCPTHGVIHRGRMESGQRAQRARRTRPHIDGRPMDTEDWDLLGEYVPGMDDRRLEANVLYVSPDRGAELSVAYAIRGPLGELRGHVVRNYGPDVDKRFKADTYPYEATGPLIGWNGRAGSTIIVVEDLASCYALDRPGVDARAVALLGTSMTNEAAQEIARQAPDMVLLCLDGDATDKAIRLRSQWGGTFGCHTRVVPLRDDIKDMDPFDVLHWYRTVTGAH